MTSDITITFTEDEVIALDLCLNGAGNADSWFDAQPCRRGDHPAISILSAAERIRRAVPDD